MKLKKTKLCFIDFFAYPLFNPKSKIIFGGAQIQLYLLAKELAKDKKFKISFLTDNRQDNCQSLINSINVISFQRSINYSFKIINFLNKLPLLSYLFYTTRLFFIFKKINADIYFQRAASAETGLIALIAKITKKKFVFMVAHQNDLNGQFVKNNKLKGKLYLFGLKLADQIVCQTKHQYKMIQKSLRSKSVIIPSGYPINKTRLKKTKKHTVLWVARAETWKNPEEFIRLATKFPKQKFTMICPPAENNPVYFNSIKLKANQVSNLTFIRQIPFNQIDTYFQQAKIFISTSDAEGFPNTFIQAAKNFCSILSFKVNPDNILTNHQLGFFAKANKDQLINFLKKLINNRNLRQKLNSNAYQYISANHLIKNSTKKLKKLVSALN